MKKLFLGFAAAVLLFSMTTTTVHAAAKAQSNTGCGLGAVLITDADSLIAQLAMTLLNGTLGNGTFGITSGTSECKQATSIASTEVNQFVAANMDSLAKDMAAGSGESLDTLAELMSVDKAERTAFNSTLQANFAKIFTSSDVDAATVIDNIATVTGRV